MELNHRSFLKVQEMFGEVSNDNRILAVALNYQLEQKHAEHPAEVILVSKDVLVRIKADVLGLHTEDYLSDRTVQSGDELYSGLFSVHVHPSIIDEFYSCRVLQLKQLGLRLHPHQFVILKDEIGTSKSALLKVNAEGNSSWSRSI